MILKSMTATFGKLEGETLTLQPGLNLIAAPNEWGKSTWCAFLLAMFYGIDTAQRASKGVLPDKERYKPWSGRPMEGQIDLTWQGRDITIQRTSRGRQPMGEFRAFETDSGVPVPELTRDNCGLLLLGVERPVYQRSGFIRQAELPVTQDEALLRRLNALVTTGNENAAGPQLEKQLRDLQNRCQHNKTGLLPQCRTELSEKLEKLEQLDKLTLEQAALEGRLSDLNQEIAALARHQQNLQIQAAQEKRQALAQAECARDEAARQAENLEAKCASLPPRDQAEAAIQELRTLSQDMQAWNLDQAMLPQAPEAPVPPPALAGQADPMEKAQADAARYDLLSKRTPGRKAPVFLGFALMLAVCLGLFLLTPWAGLGRIGGADGEISFLWSAAPWACLGMGAAALAVLTAGLLQAGRKNRDFAAAQAEMKDILAAYGVSHPAELASTAANYTQLRDSYHQAIQQQAETRRTMEVRRAELAEQSNALSAPYRDPSAALAHYQEAVAAWDAWGEALRASAQARQHAAALASVVGDLPAQEADPADLLTFTQEETAARLEHHRQTAQLLRSQLDRSLGRSSSLENPARLNAQAEALAARIHDLEDYYSALGYAQAALKTAGDDLRKRFAPQITAQARDILQDLTGGRYTQLLWDTDFSLSAGAEGETVPVEAIRRSDGTIDQIYLALRLSVCRELLRQDTPIILDDALVRFDDVRMSAALDVLRQEGKHRQILLFSCQSRESDAQRDRMRRNSAENGG